MSLEWEEGEGRTEGKDAGKHPPMALPSMDPCHAPQRLTKQEAGGFAQACVARKKLELEPMLEFPE